MLTADQLELWQDAWSALGRGAADPKHPFHWPTLGYSAPLQDAPQLRTVVLRHVDAQALSLTFYTDARSQKVEPLRRGQASLLFVDVPGLMQVTVSGSCEVDADPASTRRQALFDQLSPRQRLDYATLAAPGSDFGDQDQSDARKVELAAKHFAVVTLSVEHTNIMQLSTGWRRLQVYSRRCDSLAVELSGKWLAP